ncbi:hypothetical protein BM86_17485 [Bacillus thuringiensis]|uniref:Pesticidal crystal protein Cry domain-containing protein n=2 Tax=Bacillus thuringiensis TaxID=1428 RepID=A0A9W3SF94_BACTU|nr:hypothetical protein [Bacillus thuringiensis]ANS50149.1 hypothetical protein BT246_48130 [Bacillus thuringiensis]MBH0337218.1 hypothetical protein [Bacillus thuringiensis]MBH0337220.1 hypothetical protein [Bacillus thuringiensis]
MVVNINQASSALPISNDVAQIRTMVQGLFSTDNPNQLAPSITNYWLDYVHQQIQSLSNVYAVEKRELKNRLNQAKRLHKSQNVLISGNFEDTFEGAGWQFGHNVFTLPGDLQYPVHHLVLPPSSLVHPSYAYQIVPESALKPYTRYYLSVFVLQADSLHIIASRYGRTMDKMVNISCSAAMPTSAEGVINSPHFFQYAIDVGELSPDVDLGITVGFTVPSDGFAKISHVSLTEGPPLTAAEIRQVQHQDKQWLEPYMDQQAQITASLQNATNQLNEIYGSSNWTGTIKPDVTYADLDSLTILQCVSSQEGTIPGMPVQDNYTQETAAIYVAAQRAWNQLESRNLVPNALFLQAAQHWEIEGTVHFPRGDNNKPALTLSDWDSKVSQSITLPHRGEETEYRVRVRAKGNGTIYIVPPGDQNHMLFFNTSPFTTQEFYFFPDASTTHVDLIIQSEGSEFTIYSIEVQEMTTDTMGTLQPVEQTEASIMTSNLSMGSQAIMTTPLSNSSSSNHCQCNQK